MFGESGFKLGVLIFIVFFGLLEGFCYGVAFLLLYVVPGAIAWFIALMIGGFIIEAKKYPTRSDMIRAKNECFWWSVAIGIFTAVIWAVVNNCFLS
ncbi:MAG: hypothetical protein ACM3KR_08240 [Deltaproteobacteria bacterium]